MDLLMKKRLNKKRSEKIQLNFLKQLHRLLTNGFSLLDALYMFQYDEQLSDIANRLIKHLKSGRTIDEAFGQENFHHSVITLLHFANLHGDLIDSLSKCSQMLEQRYDATKKFHQTLRYPFILIIFFFGLLITIKQFVLPSFIVLYESHDTTSSVLNFSVLFINTLFTGGFLCILLLVLLYVFWLIFKQKMPIEQQLHVYQKIPIINRWMKLNISYQFAVHLSSLLKTGLSPIKVLDIMSEQKDVPVIAYIATYAKKQLLQGFSFSEAVESLLLIDHQLIYLLRKNLNLESLEADLNMYITLSQEKIHDRIMKTISLIQPVVLSIIATFIIFLYATLMWPMFQLIQTF